jgi:hypothetical protein
MSNCFCDYDPPEFYSPRIVIASKQHKCDECARAIQPGERYEYVVGKWDGRFDRFKTCARCLDLKEYVMATVPCLCWAHGNIIDDCYSAVDEYAHEAPGLKFGYWRRRVAIARAPRIEGR